MSVAAYIVYFLLGAGLLLLVIGFIVKRNELRRKEIIGRMEESHQQEVYESKLRFFTNIAHEFCTPLTLIQGPCDRIISHKGSDDFVLRYAGLIQRNADRMNDLIQDLIEFRRIETGNKTPRIEPVDLSGLAASLLDSFSELAESRGYTYTGDISPGIVWNTDRGFMTSILTNLISNAFKYTNRKGYISVRLSVDGGELKLVVSNTGKGIRAENIERLFDRYSILEDFEHGNDKSQTRNGLGLAISYNMIQLLGGRIEVDSERGIETRFSIHLPPAEPTPALATDSAGSNIAESEMLPIDATPAKDYPADVEIPQYVFDERKPTVMVIDDDRDMLWFICEIFSSEYNVIPVNRPSKVDELLEASSPNAIICDVMMPGIDGITITHRLKANPRTAHVPLILVSAKHRVNEQIEGLEAGADLYVTKPFNVDYLKTFVKHLLSRKETLKEYFASPISAYELSEGKLTHVEHRRFVQQVLDIINSNLSSKELTSQFIADKMNISTRHLYRKIEEAGAESPLRMIRDSRLHVARELLQNTTMTIDEIVYKSGFSNRGPFFRTFSEKFGCTPSEYRKRHIKGILV
jgi:signal transduction histidine kinase/DNA-binding response OmpR family regulator